MTHVQGSRVRRGAVYPLPHSNHALKRAKSRYGVSSPVVRKLEYMINKNLGIVRSLKQSNTRYLHEVKLDGDFYYVVFSKSAQRAITFLPIERGQELLAAKDETERCLCGRMLAIVGTRRICTGGCQVTQ